jgi:large subunit ribosomal protein LP1
MSVSKAEHDELCCVYAGLLLFDDKIDITADKINKIIEASGNKVEAYYPEFFAKYLASSDINALLNASASSAAPATDAKEEKKEDKKDDKKGKGKEDKKKKEEKKKEEEEEEDLGFGGLF